MGGGGGGGIPACRSAGLWGVVSQHALQVSRPTPRGKLRGLAGGVSRATPKGEVEVSGLGGDLQANTQGGLQGHTQGGVSQLALRQTLECILVPYCIRLQYHAWNIQ